MSNGSDQNTFTLVASASNGIYNEEVIVSKLLPRIPQTPGSNITVPARYKLKIIFWKWSLGDVAKCSTFNMELAITPVSMIGVGDSDCPDGGTCLSSSHLSSLCASCRCARRRRSLFVRVIVPPEVQSGRMGSLHSLAPGLTSSHNEPSFLQTSPPQQNHHGGDV
jgi:hypothetical protein